MGITFDFVHALRSHTQSENTQRAYYRWVDRYLVDMIGYKPSQSMARIRRMGTLSVTVLKRSLRDYTLSNWLNQLMSEGANRQALDQARASIVTLAELATQEGHLSLERFQEIKAVHVPPVDHKDTPERLLSAEELQLLKETIIENATTEIQRQRNTLIVTLLITLAIRRYELSKLKWGDITLTKNNRVLMSIGKHTIEIPRHILTILDQWRACFKGNVANPSPESPVLRRIWKGGRIAKRGLSADGIMLVIKEGAEIADLGVVTPDDVRRSVIADLYRRGVPLEEISRLLRHRNVKVTESFLAKLFWKNTD